jgi:hypothetical protein
VYYRIERTYLTDRDGHSKQSTDRIPHLVSADSAQAAVMAFVSGDRASLLGPVSEISGDKATATAIDAGRVYVVFVERASDSLSDRKRDPRDNDERAAPNR